MKASPIYNIISNNSRKSDCSFGSSDRFSQDIRVGTSSRNSHTLGEISVERHLNDDNTVTFSLWLDNNLVKRGVLNGREFNFINWD